MALVIPFVDYQRVFRVIKSVLDGDNAKTAGACKFFSVAGAYILEKNYGIQARPLAGAAMYMVNAQERQVMHFGHLANNSFTSDKDAYHCWVESEGTIIDFMAPIFQENMDAYGTMKLKIPRRMFQKPMSSMAESPAEFDQDGDFFMTINPQLTYEVLGELMTTPLFQDLIGLCVAWLGRRGKSVAPTFKVGSTEGPKTFKLTDTMVEGTW